MGATSWTTEITDYAVAHWKDGKSAAEISRGIAQTFQVRFTRNAVIGKVHRLGMSGTRERVRATNFSKEGRFRLKARAAKPAQPPKAAKVKPEPRPAFIEVLSPNARPWEERASGECAYPLGEQGEIHSCCNPIREGSRYCEGHHAISYRGAPEPRALGKLAGWVSKMESPRRDRVAA